MTENCDILVVQMKAFTARLNEMDLKEFSAKARRQGLSKNALLREWIRSRDVPTAADAEAWEARNWGNRRLRIVSA
jgi:hypothetical protein